jgi:hypothetical protein
MLSTPATVLPTPITVHTAKTRGGAQMSIQVPVATHLSKSRAWSPIKEASGLHAGQQSGNNTTAIGTDILSTGQAWLGTEAVGTDAPRTTTTINYSIKRMGDHSATAQRHTSAQPRIILGATTRTHVFLASPCEL